MYLSMNVSISTRHRNIERDDLQGKKDRLVSEDQNLFKRNSQLKLQLGDIYVSIVLSYLSI
jgi:hypothetical protein